jgi:pSer/pThr/pTyr-binding forkhead associated (FHA) protein
MSNHNLAGGINVSNNAKSLQSTVQIVDLDELCIQKQTNRLLIGRSSDCNMIIDQEGISRHHAQIKQGVFYYVQDLESLNGSYLNNKRILPGNTYKLNSGDKLRFNKVEIEIVFRIDEEIVKKKKKYEASMWL